MTVTSCLEDNESTYAEIEAWKLANEEYFAKMTDTLDADGKKYYTELPSQKYPDYKILYHVVKEGEGRTPFYTSTVTVDYNGHLYNTSSYFDENTNYTSKLSGLIDGWQDALQNMKEGDVWQIVIPWELAYGASGNPSIPGYSTLIFTIKLVDIPYWETPKP